MPCYRRLFPVEIAATILASLNVVAHERNQEKQTLPKILATIQTDDPHAPGKIKIDVDCPTDDDLMAVKNHYICRLEIDKETGVMTFNPTGYAPEAETHALDRCAHILQRMSETIRTS